MKLSRPSNVAVVAACLGVIGCSTRSTEESADRELECDDSMSLPATAEDEEPCEDDVTTYWSGSFEFFGATLSSATFRLGLYDPCSSSWLCAVVGSSTAIADSTSCPDCDWSFDLAPVEGSVADGAACADLGWTDGYIDGFLGYEFGFQSYSSYYYRGWWGRESAVLVNDELGWEQIAWNGGYGWNLEDPLNCPDLTVTEAEDSVTFITWGGWLAWPLAENGAERR